MAEGNGRNTVPGMVADMGRTLVSALPPAFLGLVVVNVIFVGLVMWFLNAQSVQRNQIVSLLIDRCMSIALHAEPPK